MRIGIFTNTYVPTLNGVVNSINGFKKGLEEAGHDVHIFAPKYPGYSEEIGHVYRFTSLNIRKELDFPLPIPKSQRILKIFNDLDLDIIHTQHPFLLGVLGRNLGRKRGIPVLTTIHTQYEQYSHYVPFNEKFVAGMTRKLVTKYCRSCDYVLTPSKSMQDYLVANGMTDSAHVVPNAVDVARFAQCEAESTMRQELGLDPNDFVLGNVGRMAIEKNIEFLLSLMSKLSESMPTVKLILVGGGPHLRKLKDKAASLGIEDRVVFTGQVEYLKIPKIMQAFDLFVMASVTEVQPLSLIESMAAGKPILGVKAFGSQDLVDDGCDGFLVDLDIDQYCEKIKLLADDRESLIAFGKLASRNAQKYSIKNATDRLLEVYEKAAAAKGRNIS